MPIDPKEYSAADAAFREQIGVELQRSTATLNRIATLLRAGLAEPQPLKEFREAVDRVREAGWIVQQSLDCQEQKEISGLLFAHRARAVSSLLKHLREDLETITEDVASPLDELLESIAGFLDSARDCGLRKENAGQTQV
ncbi:MAG: hypothetical protein ABSD88_13525 [Candidatus Korobacteraceae bacterium]|jgi:hypothetical protein